MKRNKFETLQKEYPELKQMTFNNHGFDYLIENHNGLSLKIEHKFRSAGVKVDITPTQESVADIISLKTENNEHFHMAMETYSRISKPHSALSSGYKGKSREVTQKKFIENATKDLYEVANKIKLNYGTLEEFLSNE